MQKQTIQNVYCPIQTFLLTAFQKAKLQAKFAVLRHIKLSSKIFNKVSLSLETSICNNHNYNE